MSRISQQLENAINSGDDALDETHADSIGDCSNHITTDNRVSLQMGSGTSTSSILRGAVRSKTRVREETQTPCR
eukprot:scaffold30384_cov53-Attheya_sp.AAC.14